ncbi:hypothetical protein G6F24_016401 [Rhizopus arrhizus]|nr:hypothetical protein G6F24_016401 [Rhizopus arrhizus]
MGAGPLAPLPSPAPIPDCATPAIAQNAASQSVACSGTWIHRIARCAQLHSLNSSSHADASPVGNECISTITILELGKYNPPAVLAGTAEPLAVPGTGIKRGQLKCGIVIAMAYTLWALPNRPHMPLEQTPALNRAPCTRAPEVSDSRMAKP